MEEVISVLRQLSSWTRDKVTTLLQIVSNVGDFPKRKSKQSACTDWQQLAMAICFQIIQNVNAVATYQSVKLSQKVSVSKAPIVNTK